MKFRREAPRVLIVAVMLVIAGISVLSNWLFSGMTAAVEEGQFHLMRSILEFNLRGAENRALARAEMIVAIPAIRDAFAARDREKLIAECAEMFQIQKERHGVDQAQFHVPPATSFLRLQAPDQFGDDLTPFRPMVVAVNRDHVARKGVAIARTGPAVFGVTPAYDAAGQPIGTFEFGMEFGPVLDGLKAAYDLELALFIEEQPLRQFAKGVSPEILSERNRIGKHIRFHSTHWELMQELVTETELGAPDTIQYRREAQGVPYGVVVTQLRNSAGDPIGVVAVARDFSASRAAAGRSLVWQTLLAVCGVVLLSGLVIVVLRGWLLQPLQMVDRHFAALAAGDRGQPIELDETDCEELKSLARHHESLRTQAQPGSAGTEEVR